MKALLKAAIDWRNADNEQQLILDAMNGEITQSEFQRLLMEHEEIMDKIVLPAKRALRLAIEMAEDADA